MLTDTIVKLPHEFTYRPYQEPLRNYILDGGKRACAVWHRRAGKDTTAIRLTLEMAMQRPANYWHMLPNANQARRAIWNGVNPHTGKPILDEVFPAPVVASRNSVDMRINLANGAIWQLVGSDNYNSLLGSPPAALVMSEWAVANPHAWPILEPILLENNGWAVFIYTPRGRNHGYKTYQTALKESDWFCQRLTVEDTGVIGLDMIRKLRREGTSEAYIQQEYYVSFDAPLVGSYYADLLLDAEKEGRISNVPHDTAHLVSTAWDIGHGDATAIWFYQDIGHARHWIDYYESDGKSVEHYAAMLRRKAEQLRYEYGSHWGPFDLENHDWGIVGSNTRKAVAKQLGIEFKIVPKVSVEDGIQAVRSLLPRSWFDATRCEQGLNALKSYRREEDESKARDMDQPFFKPVPLHNWASHGADAARYAAVAEEEKPGRLPPIEYPD